MCKCDLLSICRILMLEEAKHKAKFKFGLPQIETGRGRFQGEMRLLENTDTRSCNLIWEGKVIMLSYIIS